MRLYLIRHGETILNQKKCYYGVTDVSLSEEGRLQGLRLHQALKDVKIDRVISSPLTRAVETAWLVMHGRGPEVLTDERLMEQNFGMFEGMTHQEILERYPEEYAAWNRDFDDWRIPGGECFSDVRSRVDAFVKDLPGEGTVLVAAHKGTLGHLTASLLHLPLEGYWHFVFEQDCISCIDMEDGYAILRYLNRKVPALDEGDKE